jgi:hypothetical protein
MAKDREAQVSSLSAAMIEAFSTERLCAKTNAAYLSCRLLVKDDKWYQVAKKLLECFSTSLFFSL